MALLWFVLNDFHQMGEVVVARTMRSRFYSKDFQIVDYRE
jgi:hypothetical protein